MSGEQAIPRVYLGLQALQGPLWTRHRGFPRYVQDHTRFLLRHHRDLIAGVVLNRDLAVPQELGDLCGHDLIQECSSPTSHYLSLHKDPLVTTGYAPAGHYDLPQRQQFNPETGEVIYHVMSPTFPWGPLPFVYPPPFPAMGAGLVVTLHDLIPLIFPQFYIGDARWKAIHTSRYRLAQEADHVLAVSETTKSDAVSLLGLNPDRITVTYQGVADHFQPPDVPPEVARANVMARLPEIRFPYLLTFLYTQEAGRRKNVEAAIAAFARLPTELRQGLQLVLVGHGFESDYLQLSAYARRCGVQDRTVFAGLAPDDLLRELYQACELFVFPSLYEGFGLPILEAMRCGAPVIASDASATKELVQIDDARFNPEDDSDLARVMQRALTDGRFQSHLREYSLRRAQEFTWERTAQMTADCYRQVASDRARRRTWPVRRKRSVAFCAPFPPGRGDVADYSERFLETLCRRHPVQVDVVVKGDRRSYADPGHPDMKLTSIAQFRWLAERGHYDSIVYCMGNSPAHGYVYELLKEYRGIVWLHDIRLTDFYRRRYRQFGEDPPTLPPELWPWARRYPEWEDGLLGRDVLAQHGQGIYLAGEVAAYARKVVVNSSFSKELVEFESGKGTAVASIPFAAPPARGAFPQGARALLERKHGVSKNAALVITLGSVTPRKRPEAVLEAVAAAASSSNRDLLLAFIGSCAPEYRRDLERTASELGIGQRVLFPGYVDESELHSWLAVAHCAVQLRFPTNGESSSAVMRLLASGVPTIVSDHGPLRELPDGAVIKVDTQAKRAELANVLLGVLADSRARARLREGAHRYAETVSFEAVADRFWSEVLCAA